jgi:HEAT repeat protein
MTHRNAGTRHLTRWLAGCLAALALAGLGRTAHAVKLDSAIKLDPVLPSPPIVRRYSPRLKSLWLEALGQPEADLKRQAAEAIAEAKRRGRPDLADTVPHLVGALDAPDQHPVVRLAAARALGALDAREAAPILLKYAAADPVDMAQVAEPLLARWNFAPAREEWLRRLVDPHAGHVRRELAIAGLRAAGEVRAVDPLLSLVRDPRLAPDLRLKAAGALGAIRPQGWESEAKTLAADKSSAGIVGRLAAAMLLAQHRGEPAQALLVELAGDPEPAVAAIALGRIAQIDVSLVAMPMVRGLAGSADANVRRLAAELLSGRRTPEAMTLLAEMLDDEHPAVRIYAADALVERASVSALGPTVRQAAMAMLAGRRTRGLEQAAMVLGALDHKPAAPRLVELADCPVAQVNIAAAWALRRLAVPETAKPILELARRETDRTEAMDGRGTPDGVIRTALALDAIYERLEQLLQALGTLRCRESQALLVRFIPKPPQPPPGAPPWLGATKQERLRADALWSLGFVADGYGSTRLAEVVANRDDASQVRQMAAVGLGRLKAAAAVDVLRKACESADKDPWLYVACAWAIHQITGDQVPAPKPLVVKAPEGGGFLTPLD